MEPRAPSSKPVLEGNFIWSPDERSKLERVKVELRGSCLTIFRKNTIVEDVCQHMEAYDERTIELLKEDNKVGIRLKGGIEFKVLMHICKVIPDSPAGKSGQIFEKDILLHIDGHPVQNKTHDEVVELLKNAAQRFTVHLVKIKSKPKETEAAKDESAVASSEPSESNGDQNNESFLDALSLLDDALWMKAMEIQLSLTSFTRYQTGNNTFLPNAFQLIAQNGQQTMLHSQDTSTAQVKRWSEILTTRILQLNHTKVQELTKGVFAAAESKPMFLWWVNELLPSPKYNRVWSRRMLLLRQEDVQIFHTMPESDQEWQTPEKSYPVSEVVLKELKAEDLPEWRAETVFLQAGSGEGHIFAFEFHNVLRQWTRLLRNLTIASINKIQRRVFPAKWKDRQVNFCVDLQNGFLIEDGNNQEILWRQPFSRLKESSDDGKTMLHLEFSKGRSKKVCDSQDIEISNLKVALCVMEAFLTSKVASVDPTFPDSHGL